MPEHWGEPLCSKPNTHGDAGQHTAPCRWPTASSAMSAPAPEPPALVRSPEEGQPSRPEPGQVLIQLSAALENPDIRALEWSKDGKIVLIRTKLYDKEMEKNKELFPQLVNLGCVTALQAWLQANGFKLLGTKVGAQALLWQHSDFQRAPCPTEQKKGTRKRRARKRKLRDKEGRLLPVRPLYDYINLEMPELMHPSAEEDEVQGLAQPGQAPAALGRASVPPQEGTSASSALEIPAPGADDNSMQADVESMLRYITQMLPPIFSLDK